MKWIVATKNPGKLDEFRKLLEGIAGEVEALPSDVPDCEEGMLTFEGNAMQKAVFFAQYVDGMVLSDDTGLSVDALNGRPGVQSARYAGEFADDEANRLKLLAELAEIPESKRQARFVCALALWHPGRQAAILVRSELEGMIVEPQGTQGFGYDSLFYVARTGLTLAQMSREQKNSLSHRGLAVSKLRREIERLGWL